LEVVRNVDSTELTAADYLRKREEAGLSQIEIGKRTGFSRQHVARVETGQSGASRLYLECFIAAVGDGTLQTPVRDMPKPQAAKVMADSVKQLTTVLDAIERHRLVLGKAKQTLSKAIECGRILSKEDTASGLPAFDPQNPDDETIEGITDFMVTVMVGLIEEYGLQQLGEDTLYYLVKVVVEDSIRNVYSNERQRAKRRSKVAPGDRQ